MPPQVNGNNARHADQQARAYDLRLEGKTFRAIGAALGISKTHAHRLVEAEIAEQIQPRAAALRQMELDKLDRLQREALRVLTTPHPFIQFGKVIQNPETGEPFLDDGPVLQAIDRLVRISDRRSKLLGLDAPVQVDAVVTEVTQADLELRDMIGEARVALAGNDIPAGG